MTKFLRSASNDERSDEQLLERYVQSGDPASLGRLYERYMNMVYGVALKVLRDPDKAEDAVMSIYEELMQKARVHRVESFRGWLYVLARNHCLMEWRKMQRRPTDLHDPADMNRYDTGETAFDFELPQQSVNLLEKCLAGLVELQRRCVQLFYYDDKSYREIADLIREDVGKVRSYIQNGRRNLKICLEKG